MEIRLELQEHFAGRNVEIIQYPENTSKKFKSLKSYYDFMLKERDFWMPCNSGNTNSIRAHFASTVTTIESAINNGDINQSINLLNNAINSSNINRFPAIYSGTIAGELIKSQYSINPNRGNAACDYLIQEKLHGSFNDKEYFKGLLYSFVYNDAKKAFEANVTSEKDSLYTLRQQFTDEFNNLHNEYVDKKNQIDKEYAEFSKEAEEWRTETQKSISNLIDEKNTELNNLKSLYEEELRLKGPAKYWDDLYAEYIKKGQQWRSWALATALILFIFLIKILYDMPNMFFVNNSTINFNSVKVTIAYVLIASIGIYLVRLFVKLSISAYHLARDAKERCQLTHLYLSLINEKGMPENDRGLVLQALFSRADTGLLKGDSGPAFPDTIVSQLLSNIKK